MKYTSVVSLTVGVLYAALAVQATSQLRFQPQETPELPEENVAPEITDPEVPFSSPPFCRKLDCPEYTVLNKTEMYEVRAYAASQWVSTNIAGMDYSQAGYTNFMKLFRYIQGNNADGEKIAMTAPVTNMIIPGAGPACESNFTMAFFMSPTVSDPPAPTDPSIKLVSVPAFTAYVSEFGGFASLDNYLEHAQSLIATLPPNTAYHTGFWFTAGYDAPFQIFNRHNEVWFIGE